MRLRVLSNKTRLLGKSLIAVLASLMMAGCGGVTGGISSVGYSLPSVPSGTVAINNTTFASVAADAATSSSGTMSADAGAGGVTAVSATSGSTVTVPLSLNTAINRANKLLIDTMSAPQTATGITASTTLDCNGTDTTWGTETVTYDTSGNSEISFSNCGDPTSTVINGAMAATNFTYSGTLGTPPFNFSVSYSYNLTMSDATVGTSITEVGSFDIAVQVGTSTTTSSITNGTMGFTDNISGNSILITSLNVTHACDAYDSSTYACTGNLVVNGSYTVGSTLSGGSFTVSVVNLSTAIWNGAIYPNSGTITVTGANGTSGPSSLVITAANDDVGTLGSVSPVVSVAWNDGSGHSGTLTYTSWKSI